LRTLTLSLALLVFVSVIAETSPLQILYTNDIHLRFARMASLSSLIESARKDGYPTLLLDAGDGWQDFRNPIYAVWGGRAMVAWMNHLGYDAMALGNHELYWGERRLNALIEQAAFPILCANLKPAFGWDSPFVGSKIIERGGLRILSIGLITDEYFPFGDYPWYDYIAPEVALREEIAELEGSVDLIVVVAHLPVVEAARIAAVLPDVDVFVTGHSHEETPDPVVVGDTLIVQSGAFGHYLGRLLVDVDEGGVHLVRNELLPTKSAPVDLRQGEFRLAEVLFFLALSLVLFFS